MLPQESRNEKLINFRLSGSSPEVHHAMKGLVVIFALLSQLLAQVGRE